MATTIVQPKWNFEQEPFTEPYDETSINLRAYFDRMDDAKMLEYQESWSDEQLMEWDGNFKEDGELFLICSERDVDAAEYRRVLHQAREYRVGVRG